MKENCPVCGGGLSAGYQSWHSVCQNCEYEKADFERNINSVFAHELIDEGARETGLHDLRVHNFKKLLARVRSLKGSGWLLDVGCAHGWFLDVAKDDFNVLGVEPDKQVFDATSARGLPVRKGYFPDVLDSTEKFDVIVFNDVIEHIPDLTNVLEACRQHLNEDGLLVLNLPNGGGVLYRLAKFFCRIGFPTFFDRLWQKGLPSPHLHYFRLSNLVELLKQNGFDMQVNGELSTLHLHGLYTRISYTGGYGFITRNLIYLGVVLSLPVLSLLPSDIIYVISRRR